jgi:hypothetical protein
LISTAKSTLRKLSAAAPYKISAAHWTNPAGTNARLRTAEPTADTAGAHTSTTAADLHPTSCAADTHSTTAAYVHAATMHPASAASTVHAAAAATVRLLREDWGCDC